MHDTQAATNEVWTGKKKCSVLKIRFIGFHPISRKESKNQERRLAKMSDRNIEKWRRLRSLIVFQQLLFQFSDHSLRLGSSLCCSRMKRRRRHHWRRRCRCIDFEVLLTRWNRFFCYLFAPVHVHLSTLYHFCALRPSQAITALQHDP